MDGVVGSPRTGRPGPRLCRRAGQGWQDVGIIEDALRARSSPAAGPEEGPKLAEGNVGAADPAVNGRPLRAVLLHNRADVLKRRDGLNTVPAGKLESRRRLDEGRRGRLHQHTLGLGEVDGEAPLACRVLQYAGGCL
eukprot:171540-Chlamydomonas_euryale.AAC.1